MKYLLQIVVLILLPVVPLASQWQSIGNYNDHSIAGNTVEVRSGTTRLRVTVLAPDLVRIRLAPTGTFGPDRSWAVVKTEWSSQPPDVSNAMEELRIKTSQLQVVLKKRPLRLSFYSATGDLINKDEDRKGMAWDGSAVRVWKDMPQSEHYYGFGEKAGSLNRKDKHMTMWNSDIPAYKADTDPLYQSIPFFYGINRGKAYGIFFDNTYRSSFDMGKESRASYSFGAENGELNYYFFYGPDPKTILQRFTELVGRMPLPPRWSLGYQQCRWSYYPEARVRELAKTFRSKRIPADVIYLDIDYMDGYRIFTWNKQHFPDPKRMIDDLARDGFKIAVIVDPGIKVDTAYHTYRTGREGGHFLKYPDGREYVGKVWPGECAFPDFSSAAGRKWWGDHFDVLTSAGVRGFWNDMNEPSVFDVPAKTVDLDVIHDDEGLQTSHAKNHNVYGLQMTMATYDGVRALRPNERPFLLTRASYAGGHRYSAAWTGDNIASWEHLEMAVPMMLNLSISGQPFVGSDIGGFIGSPDGELFARWLQLGVFSPLMRAHTVVNSADQEPWSYGEKFEEVNRKTIELRYTLLPYIYNAMVRASETGVPPLRPLLFEFPEDEHVQWNATEFMFGDDLLIAPVLWPGQTKRELRLPKGMWYDFWTGKMLEGGKHITVDAPLERIPVFVRAGAILPTQQVVQYTDQAPIDPLTLTVYAGKNMNSVYYEDDGWTFEYERGVFLRRTVSQSVHNGAMEVRLSKVEGTYTPSPRNLVIRIVGYDKQASVVRVNGRTLTEVKPDAFASVRSGWMRDPTGDEVVIRMGDSREELRIEIR